MFKVLIKSDDIAFYSVHPFNKSVKLYKREEDAVLETFAARFLCGVDDEGDLMAIPVEQISVIVVEEEDADRN